jgi:signal transduction histidine kinase
VTDTDGVITHFISIEDEVTDERFTGQVLDVMDRVLRHNVRNATQAIGGFAELLERDLDAADPLDAEAYRTAVQTIRRRAEELETLSDRMRMIRELFRRRQAQESLSVDAIAELIDAEQERYSNASIELTMDVASGQEIRNGSLLQLAIEEAIENAVTHSDRDEPQVTVTINESDAGDEICIEIVDTGPGIPDAQWDVIKSGTETPLKHGTGIGLWLMDWTVTGIGGTLEREEAEPRGTRLLFRIPTG